MTELVGVMEDREEQLLEQVEEMESAKEKAEVRAKEKEDILIRRDKQDNFGRRLKNTLLLTAAFGVVHQAIQQDVATSCIPM